MAEKVGDVLSTVLKRPYGKILLGKSGTIGSFQSMLIFPAGLTLVISRYMVAKVSSGVLRILPEQPVSVDM